jgi:tetratricopeptide (TPR) repeat protein
VQDRYLPDDEARTQAHLRLAGYFERPVHEPDLILDVPRELRELPWQLMAARAWPKLYDLLATPAALEYLRLTPEDVLRYWAAVQRNSPLRLRDAYAPTQNAPKNYSTFVLQFVADLLRRTGHAQDSLSLLKKAAAAADEQDITVLFADRRSVNVNMLLSQATALMQIDELDQATSLAAEAESLSREIDYPRGLAGALELRAAIALKGNTFASRHDDFHEPRAALEEAERIWRELSDVNGLQVVLGNRALILERLGDLDGALALHKEEERLCRGLANQDQLRACLINQSNLYRKRKEFAVAWELATQAEQIARDLGRDDALRRAVRLQGTILWDELDEARKGSGRGPVGPVLADPEVILKLLGDRDGAVALETHRDRLCGSFPDRWQLLRQTERIAQELALRDGVHRVICLQTELLAKQIAALRALGNRRGELTLLRALERIAHELGDDESVIETLSRQATNLLEQGEVPKAMDAAQKALNYGEEHGLAESARHIEHLIESIQARGSR